MARYNVGCPECEGDGLCCQCGGTGEEKQDWHVFKCINCGGTGTCPNCGGSGEVEIDDGDELPH